MIYPLMMKTTRRIMKLLASFMLAAFTSAPAFALDDWSVNEYNGEKVYSSGKATMLLVGKRGVGFATDLSGHYREPVFISIDAAPPEKYELEDLAMGGLVRVIPNSTQLAERIKLAKKITLDRRNCWTAQCAFSLNGGKDEPKTWEFDKPLAETVVYEK